MSNLRVYMGGPPSLSEITANAGHASFSISSFATGIDIEALALHASVTMSSYNATTDTAGDPVVQSVQAYNITTTTVTITWTVDQFVTGQIEYGTDENLGSFSTQESSFDYQTHIQTLTGLTPGVEYYYRVFGENQGGGTYTTEVGRSYVFTTSGGSAGSSAGPRYSSSTSWPPLPTGSNVYVVPSSVPSNGSNAYSAMQAFIATVPDGTEANPNIIVFDKSLLQGSQTVYSMPTGINLSNREGLWLWGYNARIHSTATNGNNINTSCIYMHSGTQYITISGFELDGMNTPSNLHNLYSNLSGENGHGVGIEGARNYTVEDCVIHNVDGDATLQRGFGYNVPSYVGGKDWTDAQGYYDGGTNILQYNHCYELGRQGIGTNAWGSDVRIQYNLVEDVAYYPVDLEDGNNTGRRFRECRIIGNIFRRYTWVSQPCIPISMAQGNSELGGIIDYWEISDNVWDEGCQGCGNSDYAGCTAFYQDCHLLISLYSFGAGPMTCTDLVITNNTATLNANNLDCTRTDYGATRIEWNGTNLTMTGNDWHDERMIVTGNWNNETISNNGSSVVQRSLS